LACSRYLRKIQLVDLARLREWSYVMHGNSGTFENGYEILSEKTKQVEPKTPRGKKRGILVTWLRNLGSTQLLGHPVNNWISVPNLGVVGLLLDTVAKLRSRYDFELIEERHTMHAFGWRETNWKSPGFTKRAMRGVWPGTRQSGEVLARLMLSTGLLSE
jgi:hypothetical protein